MAIVKNYTIVSLVASDGLPAAHVIERNEILIKEIVVCQRESKCSFLKQIFMWLNCSNAGMHIFRLCVKILVALIFRSHQTHDIWTIAIGDPKCLSVTWLDVILLCKHG